jgi:hypothetical protein
MISVDSSMVKSVGYDIDEKVLLVRFNSDVLYKYFGVPYGVYDKLINAISVGKFFNAKIKNVYNFEKIDED